MIKEISTTTDKAKELERTFRLIRFDRHDDPRGSLCFAEKENLPFPVERIFWIYGVGAGQSRGEHAHRTCAELIIPVGGSFDIEVDDGCSRKTLTMNDPSEAIYIGPYVWCRLFNFSEGASCVVLASQSYTPKGYINDYEEFLRLARTNADTLG